MFDVAENIVLCGCNAEYSLIFFFFFSSRRRHTRLQGDWSSDVCSSDLTLAAGAGSRWTQGAGVVKALHPFCKLAGCHRTFLETHLAKSRRTSRQTGEIGRASCRERV